ncbi:MAG: beta-N-acetylhexosaminidase [Candidatus Pristimantibacillus sp.]
MIEELTHHLIVNRHPYVYDRYNRMNQDTTVRKRLFYKGTTGSEASRISKHRKSTRSTEPLLYKLVSTFIMLGVCLLIVQGCSQASLTNTDNNAISSTPTHSPNTETGEGTEDNQPIDEPELTEREILLEQIAEMTLEEKIGQMIIAGVDGPEIDADISRLISKDKIGGIILYADNISDLKGMVSLVNNLKQSNKDNAIPLLISIDQEGGKVNRMPKEFTALPSNKRVGATNDPALAVTMGKLLAEELKATGFNMNFAPVLDVNSNPNNPVIGSRSFGTTADLVTRMGIAEMKGIRDTGIIPVVKHFPGHGDTSVDSHIELPIVHKTKDELAQLEWLPFQAAIEQGTDAIMVAHILFPKIDADKPASLSSVIIGDQLRGTMGYDGVVMTDDMTMGAITKNYGLAEAALASVQAGTDIVLVAHGYDKARLVRDTLLNNVNKGTLTQERIDESVLRILTMKQRYPLTDQEVPVPKLTKLNADIAAWIKQLK